MGLSNENPKAVLDTVLLLNDIKTALANFKDIDALVKNAYALSEQEQKRADAARADIANNQGLLASIRQERSSLDEAALALNAKSQSVDAAIAKLDTTATAQNKRDDELNSKARVLADFERQLNQRSKEMDGRDAIMALNSKALDEREAKIEAQEADLRQRMAQLAAITSGL